MQATAITDCPEHPEETAERYAMHWLEPEEAAAFCRHAAACRRCSEILAEYTAFASLLRTALAEAASSPAHMK